MRTQSGIPSPSHKCTIGAVTSSDNRITMGISGLLAYIHSSDSSKYKVQYPHDINVNYNSNIK